MYIPALPTLAKRSILTVSFIPIIGLLVIVVIAFARFMVIRSRNRRVTESTGDERPAQSTTTTTRTTSRRTNDVELENPPPPPYQPDKLPPYVAPPTPAYTREVRA